MPIVKRLIAALAFDYDSKGADKFEKKLEDVEREAKKALRELKKSEKETAAAFAKRVQFAKALANERVTAAKKAAEAERKAEEMAAKRTEKAVVRVKKVTSFVESAITRIAQVTAAGAVAIGGLAVRATDQRQQQLAGLEGVTGSRAGAQQEFQRLQRFGRRSGVGTSASVASFTRLKNLGLRANEDTLLSLANIGAANPGKTTNDVIEAVADAATGEFERLKEFGIKAASQGNQVAFTFRGVTTTVEKNAAAITDFLTNIGRTDFAGAVERKSKTLSGALALLKGQAADLLVKIGEEGLATAVMEAAQELGVMTDGAGDLAKKIGGALATGVRGLFRLFKEGVPLLTSLVKGFADVLEFFGGPTGLIVALGSGKAALVGINAAMSAMTASTAGAATGLRGLAAAGGAVSVALAGASMIIAQTEKKIAAMEARTKKLGDDAFALQVGKMRDMDDATLAQNIADRKAEVAKARKAIDHFEAKGRILSEQVVKAAAIGGDLLSLSDLKKAREQARENKEGNEKLLYEAQRRLEALQAEDRRRFDTPDLERIRGRNARIEAARRRAPESAERRRIKARISARGKRVGSTDAGEVVALKTFDDALTRGATPSKAMADALRKLDQLSGIKAQGGSRRRRIGKVDRLALARFRNELEAKADVFGATKAGIEESVRAFRQNMLYKGGNVDAARAAGFAKFKSLTRAGSGLTAAEILERDFAAGIVPGAGPLSSRPSLGTTINRIDQSFHAPTTVQITVEQMSGESREAFADRIAAKARAAINDEWRAAVDHFSRVRVPG